MVATAALLSVKGKKARETSLPSTDSKEVPGCDRSLVPQELGFLGQESGIAPVQ